MGLGVVGSPHAGSPPGSFSVQSPAAVHPPREGVLPLGICTLAGDWSPVLKLPGGLPAGVYPNTPAPILSGMLLASPRPASLNGLRSLKLLQMVNGSYDQFSVITECDNTNFNPSRVNTVHPVITTKYLEMVGVMEPLEPLNWAPLSTKCFLNLQIQNILPDTKQD